MSRRRNKARRKGSSTGQLTIDRARKSGHYQGSHYSEVYRDGKVYVHTAWDDNAPEVGQAMDFEAWVRSLQRG